MSLNYLPSEFPDSRITPKALYYLESVANISINEELAPIWLEIATYIKIDAEAISAINSRYSEATDRSHRMLLIWLDPEMDVPKPPTWRVLLECLRANGKEELATKIEECRGSEPSIFHEIPEYLSRKALERFSKGKKAMACPKELEKDIEEKNKEIQSLKAKVSQLQEKLAVAQLRVVAPQEKATKEDDGMVALLNEKILQLRAALVKAAIAAATVMVPAVTERASPLTPGESLHVQHTVPQRLP